ncbi:MAG: DUF6614 family protein [Pseudomonadota bacterium]
MHQLLNIFDLKPGIHRAKLDRAWEAFITHLVCTDLAVSSSPVMARTRPSGFDTDEERGHAFMAVISFRDRAQADAAWAAIEARAEPLGRLHRSLFAMVHDPVFTFWSIGEGAEIRPEP